MKSAQKIRRSDSDKSRKPNPRFAQIRKHGIRFGLRFFFIQTFRGYTNVREGIRKERVCCLQSGNVVDCLYVAVFSVLMLRPLMNYALIESGTVMREAKKNTIRYNFELSED